MILRDSYLISAPVRTAYEWVNPAAYGLVVVTSSEGRNLPYGRLEDILSRDSSALNCHTNDDKNAWFAVDLGLWVIPSAYTLRHARYENKHTQGQNKRTSIFKHFSQNQIHLYYIILYSICLLVLSQGLRPLCVEELGVPGVEGRSELDDSLHTRRRLQPQRAGVRHDQL